MVYYNILYRRAGARRDEAPGKGELAKIFHTVSFQNLKFVFAA